MSQQGKIQFVIILSAPPDIAFAGKCQVTTVHRSPVMHSLL